MGLRGISWIEKHREEGRGSPTETLDGGGRGGSVCKTVRGIDLQWDECRGFKTFTEQGRGIRADGHISREIKRRNGGRQRAGYTYMTRCPVVSSGITHLQLIPLLGPLGIYFLFFSNRLVSLVPSSTMLTNG